MYVYLVQHGRAKSAEDDPNRGLTNEGRKDVMRVAEFLDEQRITVSLIQHSGKARAEETAHLLAESIRCTSSPCRSEAMAPDDDPSMIVAGVGASIIAAMIGP